MSLRTSLTLSIALAKPFLASSLGLVQHNPYLPMPLPYLSLRRLSPDQRLYPEYQVLLGDCPIGPHIAPHLLTDPNLFTLYVRALLQDFQRHSVAGTQQNTNKHTTKYTHIQDE